MKHVDNYSNSCIMNSEILLPVSGGWGAEQSVEAVLVVGIGAFFQWCPNL